MLRHLGQRKMLSLSMLACRTGSPPSLVPETFGKRLHYVCSTTEADVSLDPGPKRILIPKAPPLGLLLEAPQFGTYNERIHDKTGGITEDRDPVDFGCHAEEMQAFKTKYIYEKLRQEELEAHVYVTPTFSMRSELMER